MKKLSQGLSIHLLEPNDIVFGRKGAVEPYAFNRDLISKLGFKVQIVVRIRLQSKSLDPHFLSYYFLTENHKNWMMAQCSHGCNNGFLKSRYYFAYSSLVFHL